ncbi:NifU family protein [Candidatus Nucleicultrix amoebiphila]|jgi:Fe-S cluster biogenesis protein NfuA|uniref:Iron transporter n=1 Tax=Candidatus Nucleicultrix amoebiphila FS5 TaxID=1414854 RepID=A0A1W6N414_9PROT|nr:NifU family protein [Candidatus Nucleicultrix amoebiphila]ARN84584.1 iron transporter [Candidatus Nucleicultrix amoebiphila FS5]
MFIQTEETPNPLTLKFLPGREVMAKGTADFPDVEAAEKSLLAKNLFGIQGVTGVFYGADFITITRAENFDWMVLKPSLLGAIMEYFLTHDQVVINQASEENEDVMVVPDSEIVAEIKNLLDSKVRPAVAMDGGDIIFDKFVDGILYLRMQGACSGCPSSSATLKAGIENMLKHYIPEVVEVRAVQ